MAAQGHDLTDDRSLPSAHFVDSLCLFRFFIEPDVLKTCTVRQYRSDLCDQSALEITVTI